MEKLQCLNCSQFVKSKFCPDCGQKSDTHRITLKRFIAHDLLHGVWHFERGMLFTLKEAIVRPGKAALDYIQGKRIRYYNVFYLGLLLIGLNALVIHSIRPYRPAETVNPDNALFNFLSAYAKLLVFAIVPVLAATAKFIFQRLKLNFAEHLVVGGMCLIGIIISSIFWYLFDFSGEGLDSFLGIFEIPLILILLLWPLWTYWNLTESFYSLAGRMWRVLLFYILLIFQLIITFIAINYAITGGHQVQMMM